MPTIKNIDALKMFLLTSRLLSRDAWEQVRGKVESCSSLADALQLLERQQLLTSLQTGRILKGETEGLVLRNYKLLYRNASGSFARVFRAADVETGRMVALKLLRDRWVDDPRAVAGFQREARICQQFRHPNVVPIFEIASEGRFHFFTMEFVEGGNLRDFLKIRKLLNPIEATRCLLHICLGLEYAISEGATHRDLKLTNVLMSSDGIAKLVDFGLAGAESPGQAGSSDEVQRALEYASLERGTNAPRNDPRSDLFFAGAIYYELLTGQGPWERTRDREERLLLSRYTSVRPLAQIAGHLPQICIRICEKLMQVSPSSRYQSASEAVKDLQEAMRNLGGDDNAGHGDINPLQIDVKPDFRILIVDDQQKRTTALTEYFERHGFHVRVIASPQNAYENLKSNPPDGILFLADKLSAEVLQIFPQVQAYGRAQQVPCLAVFPEHDRAHVSARISSTRYGTTMFQPVTLRDIRNHFEEIGASTRH